jgi:hypothetical protein
MWSAETKEFLESGCALIVASVSSDGEPFASRGWGLDVVDDQGNVRVLLEATDDRAIDNLQATGSIAITATNVPTLHSMQLKGRCHAIEPATVGDRARADRFCDSFFTDIETTEGTARWKLERLHPGELVVCAVTVDELYDQTPGPGAGASLPSR